MIATVKPRRIELYINSAKKTFAQIKKETGATHIITAVVSHRLQKRRG